MNILSHSQLLSTTVTETDWLVEGLIKAGSIGFIAGEPKTTKSWLALQMAQAVATGHLFLGRFVTKKAHILYLQEEDSVETVMTRYRLLEKGHQIPPPDEGNISYAIQTGYRLDKDLDAKNLIETIKKTGARLVIVDVLNKLHPYNDSDQRAATKIMNVFEKARRATGAAILIVHHFSKGSPNKRGNQRMRGSSVLAGWSENSLYFSRNNGVTEVEVENKFAETPGFFYRFEAHNEGLRLACVPGTIEETGGLSAGAARRQRDRQRETRKRRAGRAGR